MSGNPGGVKACVRGAVDPLVKFFLVFLRPDPLFRHDSLSVRESSGSTCLLSSLSCWRVGPPLTRLRFSPSASPGTVPSKAVGTQAISNQRTPLLGAGPWARASCGLANQGVMPGSSKVGVMSHEDAGDAVAARGEKLRDDASVESRVTIASSSLPSAVAAAAMEVEDESDDERVLGGLREERKVTDAVSWPTAIFRHNVGIVSCNRKYR